jgi:hypothetical protein
MPNEENKKKDLWDKITAITPLLIGLLITGIGAIFTNIYNFRQLQLNEIAILDKFRPLLISKNPQEREFAYSTFVAVGQERLAIRLISSTQDQSGRRALEEIKAQGSSDTSQKAAQVLQTLSNEEKNSLINLTSNIYSKNQITRRNATDILASAQWRNNDSYLVKELINNYNKDQNNYFGITNTLFLLAKVNNETFKNNLNDIKKIVESGDKILSPKDKKDYLVPIKNRISSINSL